MIEPTDFSKTDRVFEKIRSEDSKEIGKTEK